MQIIPVEWIDDIRNNGDTEAWNRGNFAADMPHHNYRNKWYNNLVDPHQSYKGIGIHGQFLVIDPESQVVIAHHASHPKAADENYFKDLEHAFVAIGHYLG